MKNNNTTIKAEIVAHSLSPQGDELISVLCTFPRIILAEVNTHRMLSKNTSSSRAIPFKKMVEAIENDPFIPIAWQKEHKGMQGSEYFTDEDTIGTLENQWLRARDYAVEQAKVLNRSINYPVREGVTKQLCNRLLEPFMWTTMLITGSKEGWENFFNLRLPEYYLENIPTVNEDLSLNSKTITLIGKSKKELLKEINQIDNDSYNGFKSIINNYSDLDWLKLNKGQAEIHMMALAEAIYDAVNESTPKQLKAGEWHIPFEHKIDLAKVDYNKLLEYIGGKESILQVKISTAMAAHTSYTIVGGEAVKAYEKWIELHDKLIAYDPPHSSPMEHCARAMSNEEFVSFTKSIHSTSNKVEKTNQGGLRQGEVMVDDFIVNREEHYGWCNNLKGFIPYRYFIDNNLTF